MTPRGKELGMTTRHVFRGTALGIVVALSGFSSVARAQEAEIPLDQVPKAVMDSARAKFPGARIKEAAKETEDGKTEFELEMTHEGHNMDVSFKEDGTLVVVETRVAEKDLPDEVVQAAKDKYPHCKINLAESVKQGPEVKKKADYFELHLTSTDKKSYEVQISPKGKILKTEAKKAEEKEEDEKGEKD
jgi:Putative beta-lactamase-inhibitor-like, PepSY-like